MNITYAKKALVIAVLANFSAASVAEIAIEEVVVSARKRAENLQEVPIAVTAFTESQIESAGIQRPADFISLMPNVTMVDSANVGDTQVSIRGIVSTRDAESTFAYVVDGVLVTNPNGFNEELMDVSQIEVLKGPQGALYGRNAVAQFTREAIGHHGTIGHTRDVDASWVNCIVCLKLFDQCVDEANIVYLLLFCFPAAVSSIPSIVESIWRA